MKAGWKMSVSLLGLAMAAPSFAQAAAGDAPAASASDEIIVSATRRNERLRDVPLAITAFSQSQLTSQGIVGYEGLARQTPGIVLNKPTANFQNFTARGIATNGYGAGLQSAVAVYLDELPISTQGNLTVLDTNLYDVERVEFLRGPQGTLFGAGSLSGALRILSKSPNLSHLDYSALADVALTGSDSVRQRYNAMLNLPLISDKLAVRINGFYRHEDGYVDNIQTGVENANRLVDYGGRIILLAKPTDRLSIRLLASYEKSAPADSALTNPALGLYKRQSVRGDVFGGRIANYNATIDYQLDGAHFTSSSTYSHYDQKFIADISAAVGRAFPYALDAEGPQKTFVEEARLASDPGGKLDWVVGVYYMDRVNRLTNAFRSSAPFLAARGLTGVPDTDLISAARLRQPSHELAGFGELTYHFSDRLFATGGLRYGRSDSRLFTEAGGFNSNYIVASLLGLKGPLTIAPTPASAGPKVTGSKPSFKGSLSYRVTNDATAYVLVSTGYRAPVQNASFGKISAINPNDIAIPYSASSDKLINYEAGLKGRFLDGKLTANLAFYWIVWSNIQVQANRVSDSTQFATNIGAARSRGLEFEINVRPVPPLSFGINGSIAGTRITRLSATEAAISGARLGDRLSAPNFQGSLFTQVDFALSPTVSGYVNATVQHVGSFPNMFPFTPGRPGVLAPTYGFTDSYDNINLSLALRSGKLSATFYVENLLNDHSVTYIHPEAYLDARYGLMRPRTAGVRLGYNL